VEEKMWIAIQVGHKARYLFGCTEIVMAIAMIDYPSIRLSVKFGKIINGMGFNQAINVLAFL
jgi:hypothetical protein